MAVGRDKRSVPATSPPPRKTVVPAILAAVLLLTAGHASAGSETPPALARGVNITNWFRFPARQDPAYLRSYIPDAAMIRLKRAGFTFVRLAVQPEVITRPDGTFNTATLAALDDAILHLESHNLAVIVEIHQQNWSLETSAPDRARLTAIWMRLAALIGHRDPTLTFAELVNEPVFPNNAPAWNALQTELLIKLRARLPAHRIILTGNDWGSIDGLLRLTPAPDNNVIYSFHFYEPALLTTLAAFEPGLDRTALARLPFPPTAPACAAATSGVPHTRTLEIMRFYCAEPTDPAARIATAGAWARRHAVPLLMTEFGAIATLNTPARLAWLTTTRQAAEAQGIGWALWGYDDSMGFGAHTPDPPLDPALLTALGLQHAP